MHKTKSHYTKQNSTTLNSIHDTQTQFHYAKLNFTKHYTKLNSTKHYTKLNSTTQNSISLHKTQFTIHNLRGKQGRSEGGYWGGG